ncbi:MAG: sigma-70 family RNA polymerase sigma factor [Bacteroidetes bacterium]|nr:MAG: sigma-70 family RNA polymerase sigma factor [Bacteroidota bacterium]
MEQQFVQHISENQGIIHRVCRLYAAGQADQEDLFQEIVLQLWRAYPRFRGEAKLSTWMYRVALNTAISGLRQARRQPPLQPLSPGLSERLPAGEAEETEASGRLHLAIQALPQLERAIILLHLESYSYEEIADITGMTPNHVGVKLHRIRHKLRARLARTTTHSSS